LFLCDDNNYNMIPFSPPRIDDKICNEVVAALKSGWITTGPRTKEFEKRITSYCGNQSTLCLNSATAGLEIMLRWFGVKEGDEVILPAYTYCATANVIIHCGATPIFVDTNEADFNIDVQEIEKAITPKTKVIMPVDFAGMPCDYDEINKLAQNHKSVFKPENDIQKQLGRVLVLADAAHSFGAIYNEKKTGALCDVSVFSFHAVKNLITAEGGAVTLNLPAPFNNEEIYKYLCVKTLHGQNKDALAKTQKGNWKYDVIEAGYKCNMTDLSAAIGLIEIERYDNDTLIRRKHITDLYTTILAADERFILSLMKTDKKTSCCHLYPLRIKNITEPQRDAIIQEVFNQDVSVNVHFMPVPSLSFYAHEITLPLYYNLSDADVHTITTALINAVNKILC
jgi:dTDP-4-amino-4,6-dideoxygalactose transaminase